MRCVHLLFSTCVLNVIAVVPRQGDAGVPDRGRACVCACLYGRVWACGCVCGYVWGGCGWALTYCREESFEFGCSTGGPKTATGADPTGRLEVTELF